MWVKCKCLLNVRAGEQSSGRAKKMMGMLHMQYLDFRINYWLQVIQKMLMRRLLKINKKDNGKYWYFMWFYKVTSYKVFMLMS